MWRLTAIRWWTLLILGGLLLAAGISILLHPDKWGSDLGLAGRAVVQGSGIGMALVGVVAWIAAEVKTYR